MVRDGDRVEKGVPVSDTPVGQEELKRDRECVLTVHELSGRVPGGELIQCEGEEHHIPRLAGVRGWPGGPVARTVVRPCTRDLEGLGGVPVDDGQVELFVLNGPGGGQHITVKG